jgi:hypothetical protein
MLPVYSSKPKETRYSNYGAACLGQSFFPEFLADYLAKKDRLKGISAIVAQAPSKRAVRAALLTLSPEDQGDIKDTLMTLKSTAAQGMAFFELDGLFIQQIIEWTGIENEAA